MLAKGEPRLLPGTHFPNPCAWTPIDPSITLLSYVGPVYRPGEAEAGIYRRTNARFAVACSYVMPVLYLV